MERNKEQAKRGRDKQEQKEQGEKEEKEFRECLTKDIAWLKQGCVCTYVQKEDAGGGGVLHVVFM